MRSILVIATAAAMSTAVYAQSEQDHAAHHPAGASAPAAAKKASPAAKPQAAKAKPATQSASGAGMGAGMDHDQMKVMHDEMHKPGGMHDQMHGKDGTMGKDGKMMGGQMSGMSGMPAASAASK